MVDGQGERDQYQMCIRDRAGFAAFDVEELFSTQVGTETSLRLSLIHI